MRSMPPPGPWVSNLTRLVARAVVSARASFQALEYFEGLKGVAITRKLLLSKPPVPEKAVPELPRRT